MKKILLLIFFILITNIACSSAPSDIRPGDIVFQDMASSQSNAVKIATKSKYSHVGIVVSKDGQLYVYEGVQPVQLTPVKKWFAKSIGGHYAVKRLKNADTLLTKDILNKMWNAGKGFLGRNYDIYFEWSDDNIYCSELVWKIYKRGADIEVGKLRKLKDFDLTHPEVKKIMNQRYGTNVPYEEIVIAPEDIYRSGKLKTVMEK